MAKGVFVMFGYVVVNKPEMKIKDMDVYQSFYCGLCQCLHERYGRIAQTTLNFDMTFVAMLLSALYEPEEIKKDFRCGFHPTTKRLIRNNPCIEYAADMTILLTYMKCEDDWQDDKKISRLAYEKLLASAYRKVKDRYPEKLEVIEQTMKEITQREHQNETNIDCMASLFGKVMGEILSYRNDEWQHALYRMGDYLGRFIYLLDAYDDVEDDIAHNQYNPLKKDFGETYFEERSKLILETMVAEAAIEYEKLPILEYQDILRNIIYSGIWTKYETIRKKRLGEEDGSI